MAYYLFNLTSSEAIPRTALHELAAELLRVGMWGVDGDEPHREALSAGDVVLVYLAAPEREFVARAELATSVHEWTETEQQTYPGKSSGGVLLTGVEEWAPPVPVSAVLSRMDPSEKAKADFGQGVVRITANEWATALAVASESTRDPAFRNGV